MLFAAAPQRTLFPVNTMLKTLIPSILFAATAASFAVTAQAQEKINFPAASPVGKVEQRVGFTDVAVVYGRPGVKGRKVFGELEPWGKVWRTGANSATTISFGTDVKFGGTDVPAGKYSLFTIPEKGEWTIILNKAADQWGAYNYDEKQDQVRVTVKPTATPELVETFEISLRNVTDSSANLVLEWDKTRVSVALGVDVVKVLVPQIEAAMAGSGKKDYLAAAMFYYEHDLDLKKAVGWMNEGLKESPDAFWMIYRKGLILAKMGDKQGAIAAAQESMKIAEKKAEGDLKAEYIRLNEALIARMKS